MNYVIVRAGRSALRIITARAMLDTFRHLPSHIHERRLLLLRNFVKEEWVHRVAHSFIVIHDRRKRVGEDYTGAHRLSHLLHNCQFDS